MSEQLDGLGRPRSSRSIATGPGSRGGTYHIPECRRVWHREYEKNCLGRRKQDAERSRRRKAEYRRVRDSLLPSFTEILRDMAWGEAQKTSMYALARRMGLVPTTLQRFCRREMYIQNPSAETIDAVVAYFRIDRVYREVSRRRRQARTEARRVLRKAGVPADDQAPAFHEELHG